MRIVHFLDCGGHGGDAISALLIASEQQRMGHEVQMIIQRSGNSKGFLERAACEQVPAIEATDLEIGVHTTILKRLALFWRTLYPYAGDVLNFHTGGLYVRIADVLAMRLLPFKVRVATIHSPFNWGVYSDPTQPQKQWRRAVQLLDYVVCPSKSSVDVQLETGIPRQKVTICPNPIAINRINQGDRERVRRELNLSTNDMLVLFLARLDEEKSPIEVIRAFSAITERYPRLFLAMAGSGKLEHDCRQLIQKLGLQDRVFLLGYRTDTPDLLKAADVYMQPSIWESFGMSLIEAMAAGLPVITTRVGVIAELDQPEDSVLLVEARDIPGMTSSLDRLLTDPELRQKLADRGRTIAERFKERTVAQCYTDLYRSIHQAM